MDQVKIGKFISECRKEKELTQQELANRLGLTAKAVSKWETGKGLPDVSLYEDICKELGITLNEFFAGEHIEEKQIVTKADRNLEDILKEYYKMKKQKTLIMIILCVVLVLVAFIVIEILKAIGLFGLLYFLESSEDYKVLNDVSQYQKSYYIETYDGDIDSGLMIFPDTVRDDMKVNSFESSFKTGLFDTYGYLVLDYTLEEEQFTEEVERLKGLEATLENHDGKAYTNKVMYAEEEYSYPAYITIDGYTNTYEYALIDEAQCRIICVYHAYITPEEFPYEDYLKLEKSCYDETGTLDEFSMYSHSFDGGNSYVEYDNSTRITYQ